MSSILIIIPCFNERENIVRLIDRIFELQPDVHVLIVDDSSPDGTGAAVKQAQEGRADRLFLMERQGKGGRGSAVLDGFRFALERDYQTIFEMDADFSHDPTEIGRFLEKIHSCDLVIGSRYLPGSEIHEWGPKRTFFSKWANRYARLVLRIPITDYTNGYRCYARRALEMLDLDHIDAKGYVVLSEVAWQLHRKGAKIGEVPTVFVNRRRGISNLTSKEIQEAFLSVIRIRSPRMYKHTKQGLKFIMSGGIGSMVDLSALPLMVVLGVPADIAFYFSSFFGAMTVFFLNKHVTFRNTDRNYLKQILKFWIIYGPAIFMNGVISTLLRRLGVHFFLAKVLAIGMLIPVNYAFSHKFVFAKKRQ